MNTTVTARQMIQTISTSRVHLVILLLGFASGLPAALTASTLQAWFTEAGFNLRTIGAVTLLVLPYSFRFLWAPVFDYYKIPGLDRRRGWLLLTQMSLIAAISAMALLTPQQFFTFHTWTIPWLIVVGFITAFLSSSQDIVINAYQVEILPPEERGLGAALYVAGWRIGAIISGALALVLAKEYGWQQTYLLMAALMGIGVFTTFIAPSSLAMLKTHSTTLLGAVIDPFKDFFQRYGIKSAIFFLLLILTYKANDALALSLNTTFLLREMGFDLATVGLVNKTVSVAAALLGGLAAGIGMKRISLYHALMIFGLIQGVANLSYAAMAYLGKSFFLLVFTAFTENFCSGMGTIALVALIMSLCNLQYTATQFALLTAMAFLARPFVGPLAAVMIESFGWFQFFIWCFILSLPTLFFVYANRNVIRELKK